MRKSHSTGGGPIEDDYVLTIHFTDNVKVYRNAAGTNEIQSKDGWEVSSSQCPNIVYVKGLFDSNGEPFRAAGQSDGVAMFHGVIRRPRSEWTASDEKEVTRDTVKFYITPYYVVSGYVENIPRVPRCMPGEETWNAPALWGTKTPGLLDESHKSAMWTIITGPLK